MTAYSPRLPSSLRRLLASELVATLATPHGVDRYLELFNPLWSLNDVRAEVVASVRETADATTLRLRPNGNWLGHRAGQYVQVSVELGGVRRSRCYSVSSSARRSDGLIDITVKTVAGGAVSGPLSMYAQPGAVVTLSQAQGDYVLPEATFNGVLPTRIVLISGGSGVTPNMAMLRTLVDERYAGHIDVLHYTPGYEDAIFGVELEKIAEQQRALTLRFSLTRAAPDGADFQGHYQPAHLDALLTGRAVDAEGVAAAARGALAATALADAEIFVCGPQALIDAVRADMTARGLGARLHVEQFTAAAPAAVAEAVGGEVRFARAERVAVSDGRTLLDQAEAAGLKPDSGCRMGICMACKCNKAKGVTKNILTGEISTEPDDEIQLCVSVPVGDVTLDI